MKKSKAVSPPRSPLSSTHHSLKFSPSARLSLSRRRVSLSRSGKARARICLAFAALLVAVSAISTPAERPALVVVISVDQMRADYLERFRPYFGKDGFNRFLEGVAQFPQARHRHSITETAPGHASIGTGLDPSHHGILSNRRFDEDRRRALYSSDDPASQWVGPPAGAPKIAEEPASPILLDGASLGDRLKEKFPRARVVSVALKDRAAVFMGGRKADAAVWFQEGFGRFVTSTYYPPRPSLLKFNERLPDFFAKRKIWEPSGKIPEGDLAKITFDPPELRKFKDPIDGMGESFPHPLTTVRALLYSPYGDELILDFAGFTTEDFGLGRNAAAEPDLLFIGMSSTDYYGHKYGPDSREMADGVVRLDSTLEAFFRWLDERVGRDRLLLFLTSDHGVTPIPEVAREKARRSTGRDDPAAPGRVNLKNVRADGPVRDVGADRMALERHLAKVFRYELLFDRPNISEGAVVWFDDGYLYLNKPILARRSLPVEKVKAKARDFLRGLPGVRAAYTNTELLDGLAATEPDALAIERSFRADRAGDLLVVLKPGWVLFYEKPAGTTHGQPTEDDMRVPLLAWGAGVKAGSWDVKVSPISIARTVGALFGFEVGEPDAVILEPVLGRDIRLAKPQ